MRSRKRIVIIMFLILLSFLFFRFLKKNFFLWGLPKGKIVFASYRDGDAEIYIMNIDGSGFKRLTDNEPTKNNIALDAEPSFSPDGHLIVFTSSRRSMANYANIINGQGRITGEEYRGGANHDIYIMSADGNGQIPLTIPEGINSGPGFSPDGNRVMFSAKTAAGRQVKIVDIDDISNMKIYYRNSGFCKFSPDGMKIYDTFQSDLSVLDIKTSNRIKLTDLLGDESDVSPLKRKKLIYDFNFSMDESEIVFVVEETKQAKGKFFEVFRFFTVNVDGSGLKEVYEIDSLNLPDIFVSNQGEAGHLGSVKQLRFSLNNNKIIFLIDLHYKQGIYSIDLENRNVKELTNRNYMWRDILDFTFTPDGKKIVFVADAYPFDNPYLLGYVMLLDNLVSKIKYLLFKKPIIHLDNKYLCVMDIDGKNFHKVAKLPRGTELGLDFIHWD